MSRFSNIRMDARMLMGAGVFQAPEAGGGVLHPDAPTAESLSVEMVWGYHALTRSSHDGWGPMSIVAYTPSGIGGERASDIKRRATRDVAKFKKYAGILHGGLNSWDDIALAKELIMEASPTGRAIFEAFDRFLEEEKRKGSHEEKFEFVFPGEGTYASRRGDQDRITSWGSAISIEAGESVFALIHEIVHAMPLDQLPEELLRIPYRAPDREGLSFEDRFVRHIESAYNDEGISGLAEVLLLDDLRHVGAPLPDEGARGYLDHVRAMRDVYMDKGVDAYLDSELYIGRNHRIDYNVHRLMEIAVLAMAEPEHLKDVTISSVLAEGGITITANEGSEASDLLMLIGQAVNDPALENMQALAMHMPGLLSQVTLDPEVMVARVAEFFEAYTKGKNPRRGRGFLGKRDVTVGGLRLLGKARAVYNDFIQQNMRRPQASVSKVRDQSVEITDEELAVYNEISGGNSPSTLAEQHELERRLDELDARAQDGDHDAQRKLVIFNKVNELANTDELRASAGDADTEAEAELEKVRAEIFEKVMTGAGLTEPEKRVQWISYRRGEDFDPNIFNGEEEKEALLSSGEKLEQYGAKKSAPHIKEDMRAAGLTAEEKTAYEMVYVSRGFGFMSIEDVAAYKRGEHKLETYRRRQKEQPKATAEDADKVDVREERYAMWAAAGVTEAEKKVLIRIDVENVQESDLSSEELALRTSALEKIQRYHEAAFVEGSLVTAEELQESLQVPTLTKEERGLLIRVHKGGAFPSELPLEEYDIYTSAEEKVHAYQEAKDKAKDDSGRDSLKARVYEAERLTKDEIALYEEYERTGLSLEELGERHADGDERAGKMRDVAKRVETWLVFMKAMDKANTPHDEHNAFLEEAELTSEEWELYEEYQRSGTRRIDLYRRSKDGDAEAARLLAIVDRVDDAEKRLKGEARPVRSEFHADADIAPDALDALWNMTLDLAHEAEGARRAELIARARYLESRLASSETAGGVDRIPSLDYLERRYEGIIGLYHLSTAWKNVRHLHAAIIMRDKHEAAVVLATIGSSIAAAFKEYAEATDEGDRLRWIPALGIEVPKIMAAVGRVMRTAWKVGLPLEKDYGNQLNTSARLMQGFFSSDPFERDADYEDVIEALMEHLFFDARAQSDYVAFFFELLSNAKTQHHAKEWARLFLGSPLGVFLYRHRYSSFDAVARNWRKDFEDSKSENNDTISPFEFCGFDSFFCPTGGYRTHGKPLRHARIDEDLRHHPNYGNYWELADIRRKVGEGQRSGIPSSLPWMRSDAPLDAAVLTIPVRALPLEPSDIEGLLVYREKGGASRRDIAMRTEYVPLLRAWGQLMALPILDADDQGRVLEEVKTTLAELPSDPGARTLFVSLKMHYIHLLARYGSVVDADVEISAAQDLFFNGLRFFEGENEQELLDRVMGFEMRFISDLASLVKANVALAIHESGDHEEARRRVENIHDYYESIVRLRRQGVYPDGMARAAQALSRYPEYRDAARRFFQLAIEHSAAFKNDEGVFPSALAWIIRSIDGAALPYDLREDLMSDLVRTVIPEVRGTAGYSPQEIQLKAYHVARVNDVIYERGLSVHLARYGAAEALLYNRTADLIEEYGSMATSNAMLRGHFLQAAMRINRELSFTKSELVAATNIETFQRMDDAGTFQLDLADVFPTHLAAFDPDAPVGEWNPSYVRRGVPDPEQSFARIAEAVGHDASEAELGVYAAFVRWEIDRAAANKPRNYEALENIAEAYQKRIEERGEVNDVEDVTSLDEHDLKLVPKYAMGIGKMLSKRELMVLDETLQLPSVAFAFDRLGSVFDEGRVLSAEDERILLAALDARDPHEALAKRELFLYTLLHDAATLKLKRRAAHNLALSFKQEDTIARLIDAYEKTGDAAAEERLYQRITGFWYLTGQLPSDYYLFLLDTTDIGTTDPIERLEELMRSNGTEATVHDLELRYGWTRYYAQFIEDCQTYVDKGFRMVPSILHRDQVAQYLAPLKDEPSRAHTLVRELRARHQNRIEEIQIAKANLPNIFLKQDPVVRFLLLSYFEEMNATERARLVQEMNELEQAEGSAETFMHFFEVAGLEKVAQALSTLVGIVREDDRAVFARAQDRVPAGSVVEVRETIEREQRARIEEIYSEFDDTPIASASIAEVYRARLKETGEEVYVKVIPRSKRIKIRETAARLRRVAAKFEQHQGRFNVGLDIAGMLNWFADELDGQLNLRKEMRSAVRFGHEYDALTPEYVFATENVLVMSPLDGIKVTELGASSPHRRTAARAIAETGVRAVLWGSYHADPHPGNIFVGVISGDVSWLDFGTTGSLDAQGRIQLMDFLFTLALNDAHAQRMALEAMGTPDASYDAAAFEAAITELGGIEVTERAARIIALAGEHHLFVRRQSSQAITNLLTIKGVVTQLDPEFDFASVFNEHMPAAYAQARAEIEESASDETGVRQPQHEKTSIESVVPREQKSTLHERATALYGLIEEHMDDLEEEMGENAFERFDEQADELLERAETEPGTPVERGLDRIEETLREHLGDAIVDAALGIERS